MKKVLVFLMACLASTTMFAQLHYQINSQGCGPMNTKLAVILVIDGVPQVNPNLEIGVFDQDGICRGAKKPVLRPATGQYIFTLQMKGIEGYTYYTDFKVWDHDNEVELDIEYIGPTDEYYYQGNYTYSTMANPIDLPFQSPSTGITKDITGFGENLQGNWYLIASPVGQVEAANVAGMTDGNYGLFAFDQSEDLEWRNFQVAENNLSTLDPGYGYLYAHQTDTTITFSGTAFAEPELVVPLVYVEEAPNFPGWNLLGNPYNEDAYMNINTGEELYEFYVMNGDGDEIIPSERMDGVVYPMEGVFVAALPTDVDITFFPATTKRNTKASLALNLTQGRGNVIDRAIVRFGEGRALPKFMLNSTHTNLYIPQGSEKFATVASDNQGEMPVNFSAAENGTYTLSVNTTNTEMNYLHLIDNMTGDDVNLLETPSYTFEAKTTDYASRFRLVFATGNSDEDNFAFFSNGNLVVSNDGNATLQVIDVNGRILNSESINGSASIRVNAAAGVYMIRLINGDNVKVQKVVVK